MKEAIGQRLQKLLALAKRGVGGEKENAKRMLTEALAKHGLTIDDICDDVRRMKYFKYRTEIDKKLLHQIVVSVTNDRKIPIYKVRHYKMQFAIELTADEAIEIQLQYDAYRLAFKKEVETLYTAFIYKHDIFPSANPEQDVETPPEQIDREEIEKIRSMMDGLSDVKIRKQIGECG